jgi:hypothetical protein
LSAFLGGIVQPLEIEKDQPHIDCGRKQKEDEDRRERELHQCLTWLDCVFTTFQHNLPLDSLRYL